MSPAAPVITMSSNGQQSVVSLFAHAKALVRAFAHGEGIDAAATAAFGPGVTAGTVQTAILDFERVGWPALVVLDDSDLHGARGAYDAVRDTIYLSREFLAEAAPAAITAVIVEEIGHAIDARVQSTDAPGDEGEIFADYVLGHVPGAAELAALKAENDHGTILVNGVATQVEFAAPVAGSVTLDGSLSD